MKLEATFRTIDGTSAASGIVGNKTIVADRRAGSSGGLGIGLSGGELQALALGAGYFNQLHFSASELGIDIVGVQIDVELEFIQDPLLISSAVIKVRLEAKGGADDEERLLAHADRDSTISNSVVRGFPVTVDRL